MAEEVKEYIKHTGKQGHNASRLEGRIRACIPFDEDYEAIRQYFRNILKKHVEHKGERQYQDKTIDEIIKEYQKYLNWEKSKGENTMTLETSENEITITQEQQTPVMPVEEIPQVKSRAGRPISTNRTDKITLYMSASMMKTLTALASYDKVSLTGLINGVLERYLPTRSEDIKFLQELERMKEEHRQKIK